MLAKRQLYCAFYLVFHQKFIHFRCRAVLEGKKIFLRRSLKMKEYCRIPRLSNKHQGNFAFQNLFIPIWFKPYFTTDKMIIKQIKG